MTAPAPAPAPHVPVLLDAVTELLERPDGVVVDLTLGAGGHARAVVARRLQLWGHADLLGVDRDEDALALARERLAGELADPRVRVRFVHARADRLGEVLDAEGIGHVAGVLLDLGVSSMHLDRAERGFAHRLDGPLDMRMDRSQPTTAADLVNGLPEDELAGVIRRFGEERFARRIAAAIVAARPVEGTRRLAELVRDAVPAAARRTGGHPAARTFQALRIAVNEELAALEATLPVAIDRLDRDGVLVVLSYHSLEDRIVKRAFAAAATGCICPPDLPVCGCGRTPLVEHVVRRPIVADAEERRRNPRSASVRLRAVRRLAVPA
ncbi:MAG: s-adenosyl-methyltransferase mraw [Actinomycetota bacterium]|jgi:16S rRNA (cytosine1402-N4)-methyltransferase